MVAVVASARIVGSPFDRDPLREPGRGAHRDSSLAAALNDVARLEARFRPVVTPSAYRRACDINDEAECRAWRTETAGLYAFAAAGALGNNHVPRIDAAYIGRIETLYHDEDQRCAEYLSLLKGVLRFEHGALSEPLRRAVDDIRQAGEVPLFRTVIGTWVSAADQDPFEVETYCKHVDALQARGMSRDQALYVTHRRFRDVEVSTSLSLMASIEVPLAKRRQREPQVLTGVVFGWDGREGASGSDPFEICIDPLRIHPRLVYTVAGNGFEAGSYCRVIAWPRIAAELNTLVPG